MSDAAQSQAIWQRARLAMGVLALDPAGMGGLWLRARSGPVRDRFLQDFDALVPTARRIHPTIDDETLLGGLNLTATLSSGQLVESTGLVSSRTPLILTMAERCPPRLAAHVGAALDQGGPGLLALDEGAEDEAPPAALTERLGLFVSLDGLCHRDMYGTDDPFDLAAARGHLAKLTCTDEQVDTLVVMAAKLGIDSLRVPLFAVAAARAIAALFGRNRVTSDDVSLAAELVFAHRAVLAPEAAEEAAPEDPLPEPGSETDTDTAQGIPEDILLEAVKAALPSDVLAQLAEARRTRAKPVGSGSGARLRGNRRGRPIQSRPGRPGTDARVDLIATLRAAAPWQTIRKRQAPTERPVHIRKDDIRLRRYETRSDRLLIFAVDASGSAAMARLAEAKGAIEILLGEAYARRDHVALVAFRGEAADLLLTPTRSLVQTKRRLQALPGGGGTPLAAGLKLALETAHTATARGMTPTVVLLTDGRANIALDGSANRAKAATEADDMARLIRSDGISALVIDTALRPQPALNALSQTLSAPYIALPRADAHRLSDAVRAATDG